MDQAWRRSHPLCPHSIDWNLEEQGTLGNMFSSVQDGEGTGMGEQTAASSTSLHPMGQVWVHRPEGQLLPARGHPGGCLNLWEMKDGNLQFGSLGSCGSEGLKK